MINVKSLFIGHFIMFKKVDANDHNMKQGNGSSVHTCAGNEIGVGLVWRSHRQHLFFLFGKKKKFLHVGVSNFPPYE